MLVHDAEEAGLPPAVAGGVVCRVRVLLAERVGALAETDGEATEIHDADLDDLLAVLEGAEWLLSGCG